MTLLRMTFRGGQLTVEAAHVTTEPEQLFTLEKEVSKEPRQQIYSPFETKMSS